MKKIIYIILILTYSQSCVEPFEAETQGFENALVVDARLTDEEKQHEVLLSRARLFEIDSIDVEENAKVEVVDDLGNSYDFTEVNPGKYISKLSFGAQKNRSYQLSITTSDGKLYTSKSVETPDKSKMGNLSVKREVNANGDEGVSVLLDNSGSDISKYRRYEYEETYKIIAPFYSPLEFDIINDTSIITDTIYNTTIGFRVDVKLRTKNVSTCYNSLSSTEIILGNAENVEGGKSSRFSIRFINRDSYIISHRYSILVKQLSLNSEAHAYYSNLQDFSSTENVFSQVQPGFLEGNIFPEYRESSRVVGYFEVSSVAKERIFFNYPDIFPEEPLPPYAINCEPIGAPPIYYEAGHASPTGDDGWVVDGIPGNSPLVQGIKSGLYAYYATNEDFLEQLIAQNSAENLAPYFTKSKACGDCTVLGSVEIPVFWIE